MRYPSSWTNSGRCNGLHTTQYRKLTSLGLTQVSLVLVDHCILIVLKSCRQQHCHCCPCTVLGRVSLQRRYTTQASVSYHATPAYSELVLNQERQPLPMLVIKRQSSLTKHDLRCFLPPKNFCSSFALLLRKFSSTLSPPSAACVPEAKRLVR